MCNEQCINFYSLKILTKKIPLLTRFCQTRPMNYIVPPFWRIIIDDFPYPNNKWWWIWWLGDALPTQGPINNKMHYVCTLPLLWWMMIAMVILWLLWWSFDDDGVSGDVDDEGDEKDETFNNATTTQSLLWYRKAIYTCLKDLRNEYLSLITMVGSVRYWRGGGGLLVVVHKESSVT